MEEHHVRPFPNQPHRGGKQLIAEIDELEAALIEDVPDIEGVRTIQKKIHDTVNTFNDDRLIDLMRMISNEIDTFCEKPETKKRDEIMHNIMKVRVELKHL